MHAMPYPQRSLQVNHITLWFRTAKNWDMNHSLSHELGSERVSEIASKRMSVAERASIAEQCGAIERANGRASGPLLASRFLADLNH